MPHIPYDLHILQHSLGLDEYGRGESRRNYFATDPGYLDHDVCVALVWAGLMTIRRQPRGYGGMDYFFVTEAGRAHVSRHSPQPPKLTRSQRRWRRYLDGGSELSFGEWLQTSYARAWEREAAHG